MKLLLFNVDLTLVSTGGAGRRAIDRAFAEVLGVEGAMEGILPHGKTDPAIVREVCRARGLDNAARLESDTARILERYIVHLRREVALSEGYRVLPGVVELLDDVFGRDDVVLGLATGNIEVGARIKLERGGLNRYFAFGGFGSDSEARFELVLAAARAAARLEGRPIEPEHTFVIGDTPLDVGAGRRAGFRTIAVATGRHPAGVLAEAGADLVLEDLAVGRDQFLRSTRIR